MAAVRVVLRDEAVAIGERLQEITKCASLAELINLMFSRYGTHLELTWEVRPIAPSLTIPEPFPDASPQPAVVENFTFEEPLGGL